MKTLCFHCGRSDAPTEGGRIDRHRRADWKPDTGRGNELCLASFTRPAVGERCHHVPPSPDCVGATA